MTRDDIIAALSALELEDLSMIRTALDAEIHAKLHELDATGALTPEERQLGVKGDKIGCVKLIRLRTGLGLRDAKDYMDRAFGRMP